MAKVGYVGLGSMDGRMAARLFDAGHQVVGYNRTPDRARCLVERGLRLVSMPRGACEGTNFVISMVTNSTALQAVTERPEGLPAGLGPGLSEGVLPAERDSADDGRGRPDQQRRGLRPWCSVAVHGDDTSGRGVVSVTMMQKDMTLALEMGRQVGVPLPTAAVTNQYLTAARSMGLSDEDFAMMFKVLAHGSGVPA